jgi:hypothetical protein
MFEFDKLVGDDISKLGLPFIIDGKIENIYHAFLNNKNTSQLETIFSHVFHSLFYLILEIPDFYFDDIKRDFEELKLSYKLLEKDKIKFIYAKVQTDEQVQLATEYSLLLGDMNNLVIWSNEKDLINVEITNKTFLFSMLKKKTVERKVKTTKNSTFIWFDYDLSGIFLFSNELVV